jgi:DNA-binding protein H-NS
MATLSELLAQKAELEQKILETQRTERAEAIAKVRALMSEYGLSAADLTTRAPVAARKSSASGSKLAPKYRNAATGDTWSGRGLQPKWLRAELASGRTLDEFAV